MNRVQLRRMKMFFVAVLRSAVEAHASVIFSDHEQAFFFDDLR